MGEEFKLRGDANSIAVPGCRRHALRAAKIRKRFQRASSDLPLGEWIGGRTRETWASSVEPQRSVTLENGFTFTSGMRP